MKKTTEEITIYHKPNCIKSREAYDILKKQSKSFTTIEYLKTPPTQKQLKELLQMLGIKAEELVRKKESLYKENYADKKLTEAQWIKVLAENPILIERPVVVRGNKAVIGRPIEKVIELLA